MPAVIDAVPMHQVEVAQLRKEDYAELKAWAEEAGVTTDQLGAQILRVTTQILSQRGKPKSNNVVPFAAPR